MGLEIHPVILYYGGRLLWFPKSVPRFPVTCKPMSIVTEPSSRSARRAAVKIVYLGPVSPHWEIHSDFGDRQIIEEFRARVLARLVLLPPHDPQFRRNRERVDRDAERENISLEWDLGLPEDGRAPELASSGRDQRPWSALDHAVAAETLRAC